MSKFRYMRPNPRPGARKATLTLQCTLRCAGEKLTRKVTVPWPKNLYQFEMKYELAGMVLGFKTMTEILRKQEVERTKERRYRRVVTRERVDGRRRNVIRYTYRSPKLKRR